MLVQEHPRPLLIAIINMTVAEAEAEGTEVVAEGLEMEGLSIILIQAIHGLVAEAEVVEGMEQMEVLGQTCRVPIKVEEEEEAGDTAVMEVTETHNMEEAVEDTAVPDMGVVGLMLPEVRDLQQVATGLS